MRAAPLFCLALFAAGAAQAAAPREAERITAQRAAMAPLAWMDGRWRGPASNNGPGGQLEMTQTERVGPFLDGSVKLVEGRALDAAGAPNGFNALGVITYDPDTKRYTFHTFAHGYALAAPMTVSADGWSWEQPAGPGRSIRFSAVHADGQWRETGVMTGTDTPPQGLTVFQMTLDRVGDTDWPAAGAEGRKR
jgi:hypothetical protein